jgi:hypothetical protein
MLLFGLVLDSSGTLEFIFYNHFCILWNIMQQTRGQDMKRWGDILKSCRNAVWSVEGTKVTARQMAEELGVNVKRIYYYESGLLPKTRNRLIDIFGAYRTDRTTIDCVLKEAGFNERVKNGEWEYIRARYKEPLKISPMGGDKELWEKLGEPLANKLHAKEIIGDIYIEKPQTSGIFRKFEVDYHFRSNGFCRQYTKAEIFQLRAEQEIATPLYMGLKASTLKIKWNSEDIHIQSDDLKTPEVDFVDSKHYQTNICYFHKGLYNQEIGQVNTLKMEAESRSFLCEYRSGMFAICLPYFYALIQGPSDFRITLPANALRNISVYYVKRDTKSGNPSEWFSPSKLGEIKNEEPFEIVIPHDPSDVFDKRYCPDLVIIRFDKEPQQDWVTFVERKKRPAHIDDSYTFFCGREEKECPMKGLG